MITYKWIRICFFNLLIVALIGALLRYKIAFYLPLLDQKHLLHSHSHFAFNGWITLILMVLIFEVIGRDRSSNFIHKYRVLLLLQLISAYGMLISFAVQGYGLYSISFSTLSIFVSYVFTLIVWKQTKPTKESIIAFKWLRAAVIWNVVSSLGAFALAYMMATKTIHQNWYLIAVYFFLHFQYNGWFLFACIGLAFKQLQHIVSYQTAITIFRLLLLACLPAYFLSVLWINMPEWLYVFVIIAAILQLVALFFFFKEFKRIKKYFITLGSVLANRFLMVAFLAFCIKIILQLGSTIPFLSKLAFGFRPIVIGYLHLVLLSVITFFIFAYVFYHFKQSISTTAKFGSYLFAGGVIANEMILLIQGVGAIEYTAIPHSNEILFIVSIFMVFGLMLLNSNTFNYSKKEEHDGNHN